MDTEEGTEVDQTLLSPVKFDYLTIPRANQGSKNVKDFLSNSSSSKED